MSEAANTPRTLLGSAASTFRTTMRYVLVTLLAVAVIACVWRFLDLYERNTQAAAVHARIAMERHEAWKAALQAQRNAMTPAEIQREAGKQVQSVPNLDGSPAAAGAEKQ